MSNLLNYIDSINSNVNDAKINVLQSQLNVYSKASMLLEYYEGDDLSAFDVFQEQTIREDMKEQAKGMGIIKKFLTLIPRLIRAILNKIKNTKSKDIEIKEKVEGYDVNKKINNVMKSEDKNKIENAIKIAATAGVIAGLSAITVHKKKKKNNKNKSQTSSNTDQPQSEEPVKDEQKTQESVKDESTVEKPKKVKDEQEPSQPEEIKNDENVLKNNTEQPKIERQEEVENSQSDETILTTKEIISSVEKIISDALEESKTSIETFTKEKICEDIINLRYKHNENIIKRTNSILGFDIKLLFTKNDALNIYRKNNSFKEFPSFNFFWKYFNVQGKGITYTYSPFFLFNHNDFLNITYLKYEKSTVKAFKDDLEKACNDSADKTISSREPVTFGVYSKSDLIDSAIKDIERRIDWIKTNIKDDLQDPMKTILADHLACLNVFVEEANLYMEEARKLNDLIINKLNSIYDNIINQIKDKISDFYLKNEKSFSDNNINQDDLEKILIEQIEKHDINFYLEKINNKKENN